MPSWQNIIGDISIPPPSGTTEYSTWSRYLAIVDDTTAQFATLMAYYRSHPQIIKDLNRDDNHLRLITYIENNKTKLTTDRLIRAAVQHKLQMVAQELYPDLVKYIPEQWGQGQRLINPRIGLL